MATHDYIISNASGAAVRADLNNALAAIASNNSAATEPTTTYAYQWWADTGSSPTVMKLRNAANSAWITLFQLDGEWSLIPFENGTAAAPSIYFKDSGTDTGLFSGGTDQVNVTTGGVERVEWGASEVVFNDGGVNYDFRIEGDTNANLFFVDASADRIGIGTASPSTLLHVASTAPYIRIQDTDSSTASAAQGGFEMYDSDGDRLFFLANDSSSSADVSLFNNAGGALKFGTSGSERGQFDSSGRLLVGTSSSSVNTSLVLNGSSGGAGNPANVYLQRNETAPVVDAALGQIFFANDAGNAAASIRSLRDAGTWTTGSSHPGRLVFSTTADGDPSPTERMRITNSGNILFGTTGTPNGTSVYGSAFTAQTNSRSTLFCATSSTASQKHAIFYNPNGEVGSISTNASATAYTTSSDYRLKENVTPLTGAAARIQQLKPSRFNFIADPDTEVDGFIAHEAAEVVPECVIGIKDEVDEDGNPVYQGIDQSKLVPLLTAALQEAVAKIESLEARLTAAGI